MKKNRFLKQFAAVATMLCLAAGLAWATITPLPIVNLAGKGPFISGQPVANSLNFVFTACDNTNGNSFVITGSEVLLIQNTDTMAAHTFTVTSIADILGRTQDVTAYSVPLSAYAVYNFRQGSAGFRQTDGTVHLTCSASTLSFAVLTSPN